MVFFLEVESFLFLGVGISMLLLAVGMGGLGRRRFLKERREAYECGFDAFTKKKSGFCVRFFNIAILYLLIDLEIAFILPFFLKISLLSRVGSLTTLTIMSLISLLLILLLLEFFWGGLRWKEDL